MESKEIIEKAIERLYAYCKDRQFKGYDPYDALNSKLFRLFIRLGKPGRTLWTQFFKHCPFNLRKAVLIPRGHNPKGLGLFLSGLAELYKNTRTPEHQSTSKVKEDIRDIAKLLKRLASPGYNGYCWGYNFPWQSRAFFLPAHIPTVVATSYIASAFLDAYSAFGNEEYFNIARSSCNFVLKDLNRTETADGFCFSYSPLDRSRVYNASILGARLLLRVAHISKEEELFKAGNDAAELLLVSQHKDGSWDYGAVKNQKWIDSFHTGFNLESLKECMDFTGKKEWMHHFNKGLAFYREHFFTEEGLCKYYHNKVYPVDIHSIAQAIITFVKVGDCERAEGIALWAIENMQDREGYFYYQKHKFYTNKIPYMRWSQAWMFYALAMLVKSSPSPNTPLTPLNRGECFSAEGRGDLADNR